MPTALTLDPSNPFAAPSTLPYRLPDFAAIRTEHYLPAFEAGMAAELAEVDALLADPAPPDEENLLLALERTGALLDRVSAAFWNLVSSDSSPDLDAIEEEIAPRLAAHHDAIYLDPRLYSRVEALAARVESAEVSLPDDAAYALEHLRRDLVRAGAGLSDADQARVKEINARTSTLEAAFSRELLADTNDSALLLTDPAELAGLSDGEIAAARQAAADRGHAEGWLLELSLFSAQPMLASLADRDVRRRLYRASLDRGGRGGEHDTRAILLELVRLRAERARLLGYEHHAAYVAADGTAKTSAAVQAMLGPLAPAAAANARAEAADLEAALRVDEPGAQLEGCDWPRYAERVRAERFSLDDAALRPYLELDRVVHEGVFRAAHELYGLDFTERTDLVGYHPQVRVFEVRDADGSEVGLFLADWYTRASKQGGAWMNSLVDQSHLLDEKPVVVNNLNVPKPPDGEPTLLTWDFVITLFHEFGHALHGLLSDVRLPSQSGTDVPRDVVEFPSQVNEMWAWEPSILEHYAVHHVTGEPMPAEWVETLRASRQFNEGFATTEYLGAALLDQAWHRLVPEDVPTEVDAVPAFEAAALEAAGVTAPAVAPRYRTTYFNHVFGGGYSAAYYSYLWAEVLDADTVEWFAENGGLTRGNGDRFRAALLSRGGSGDMMAFFRDLRGRDPRIEPLLVRRGLTGS
ncbi:M3 family metallopeptidase [Actinotalea sp. M2MS4P-6]|uniref:M3 family metallopeptidase n=1 Tax=Actinotalea sp. M2MS4P-6 TaxID=2983762 RepID=UPI0021E399D2|nr:M3 family metallopeptidase [Actinotalea sp. M2MS4P-6]MCV2394821.1 M3 family metallopeptidase [Actinotalea sp. M2MS4P-6]